MRDQALQEVDIQNLLREKSAQILTIAARRKAHNVRIFGSMARGQATATSDVDFLVDFDADASLWDHVGLWQDLTELLQCEVDVVTEDTLREGMRRSILRDAVSL